MMDLMEKLTILAEGAKYDAACTSSGSSRTVNGSGIGSTVAAGCCHSFSADGRCISLLKVLMTNYCVYDCKYCVNRKSNDIERAAFTPQELAELTIQFYRRNYIEGLFLSSGVTKSPDDTMEHMVTALELLRYKYGFWGYIHAKVIPGASERLISRLGALADRISVNIELPSEKSLISLAPNKTRSAILSSMNQIAYGVQYGANELAPRNYNPQSLAVRTNHKNTQSFAPAGQATQIIIGASPESDYHILKLAAGLYDRYKLKRVFYSAYIPVVEDSLLPSVDTKPPLLREHRLYQADWLLRQYQFTPDEILSERTPDFNPYLDPKCNWAVHNPHYFPIDINKASLSELLRVPGIGPKSARAIIIARKAGSLGMAELKRIGVVLKRARYFIIANDCPRGMGMNREAVIRALIDPNVFSHGMEQLSFFSNNGLVLPGADDAPTMKDAVEEAVLCLASSL